MAYEYAGRILIRQRSTALPDLQVSPKLKIHYIDENPSGSPAVLLLHGLGANGSSWQLQFPDLVRAGYRVLAPDARGFGQSTYPGGEHRVRHMAADMLALLEALQTGPAHVVGISMGGTLALQMACDAPQSIRKLVLVNTFARLRPGTLQGYLHFATRFVLIHTIGLHTQAEAVAKYLFPGPGKDELRRLLVEQIMQSDPRGYRVTMRALGLFDVLNRLGQINLPTMVISGQYDQSIPIKNQMQLVRGIPGVKHRVIPDAGHAVIVDQPEAFNQVLLEFLQEP